jgi:hypothetical protein
MLGFRGLLLQYGLLISLVVIMILFYLFSLLEDALQGY